MPCIVQFCRRDCQVVPEGTDINRASWRVLCVCGSNLGQHTMFSYPTGMGHCVRDCEGNFWHL